MKKYFDGLAVLLATAWVGGMWAAGYLAAPVLFQSLPDKMLAGMLAGKLFAVTAQVGLISGLYLLAYYIYLQRGMVWAEGQFRIVVAMLLLVMLGHFGMQPVMAELKAQALPRHVMETVHADRFRLWHGAASVVYLLQSLLGGALLLKLYARRKMN